MTPSLSFLPTPALFVDEAGVVLFANQAAATALERSLDDLRLARLDGVLFSLESMLASANADREERTHEIELPSGRRTVIGFSVGIDETDPSRKRYLVLFRDLSKDMALREERDRLLKIAGVSSAFPTLLHELRTPLASITATVEVLVEDMESSPVRDQLHAVLAEVRRMKLSLDGVITVGRSLRSRRCSAIDQACRDAWQIMATRARSLGIHSRCHVEDMPLLPLDPAVIGGIAHNLMMNAIQACSPGQAANLEARLRDGGSHFTLTVVDNGSGMTNEVYARCTELFFTTKRNGSGIGLALCRRVAEEAGGRLTIESVLGFGTAVTIDVPIAPSEPMPPVIAS